MRVQVSVGISKPNKTGLFTKNDDGSTRWLAFKYERLSDLCFTCGKLGHISTSCKMISPVSEGVLDPR